jgi:hypothetical protein
VDGIREHRTSVAADGLVTNFAHRGVGAALGRGERALARDVVRGVFPRSTTERAHHSETDDDTEPAHRVPDGSDSGSTGFDGLAFAQDRYLATILRNGCARGASCRSRQIIEVARLSRRAAAVATKSARRVSISLNVVRRHSEPQV